MQEYNSKFDQSVEKLMSSLGKPASLTLPKMQLLCGIAAPQLMTAPLIAKPIKLPSDFVGFREAPSHTLDNPSKPFTWQSATEWWVGSTWTRVETHKTAGLRRTDKSVRLINKGLTLTLVPEEEFHSLHNYIGDFKPLEYIPRVNTS
eukprot:scaffold86704_cov29-Prasinocladus_malaysianus.AAC.1